ncbi:divergent polysaccharide deacteylase family protein [Oceanomicrobium pacificus]|uniref:Divergent polysaccharide deacetylase family protein n=1 Tax=Oceanomicrobium pacificus TaxID=2692916 RepID=A0A6B0TXD7_9RHOB|nr:divergent polysaccharide deacteylase family protein [Oceanomicrobium pacificus]MXU65814.1 hypothetical protein [Oceanomicrobium pacificus]
MANVKVERVGGFWRGFFTMWFLIAIGMVAWSIFGPGGSDRVAAPPIFESLAPLDTPETPEGARLPQQDAPAVTAPAPAAPTASANAGDTTPDATESTAPPVVGGAPDSDGSSAPALPGDAAPAAPLGGSQAPEAPASDSQSSLTAPSGGDSAPAALPSEPATDVALAPAATEAPAEPEAELADAAPEEPIDIVPDREEEEIDLDTVGVPKEEIIIVSDAPVGGSDFSVGSATDVQIDDNPLLLPDGRFDPELAGADPELNSADPELAGADPELSGADTPAPAEQELALAVPDTAPALPQTGDAAPAETGETPAADAAPEAEAADAAPEADTPAEGGDGSEAPVLADAGGAAFEAFAQPYDGPGDKPVLSIILVDVGADGVARDDLLSVRVPVTFALAGDNEGAAAAAMAYREAGHEVVVFTPYDSLTSSSDPADTAAVVQGMLDTVPGALAVMDQPGGSLHRNRDLVKSVLADIKPTGHALITNAGGLTSAAELAAVEGVPAIESYRVIDDELDVAKIGAALDRSAFQASKVGSAVVIGHTFPETVNAILSWLLNGRAKALEIAPVSVAIRRQVEGS